MGGVSIVAEDWDKIPSVARNTELQKNTESVDQKTGKKPDTVPNPVI